MGTSMLQGIATPFLVIVLCPAVALGEVESATDALHREVLKCGPNALFVFLILSGHPEVTLAQCEDMPLSSAGTSLLAICDAAARFQVDAEIRRYRPEEIDLLPLPAIGHFNWKGNTLEQHHFLVVYRVNSERVYVVDGTTGAKREILRSRLPEFWTGFAMSQKRPVGVWPVKGWPLLWVTCLIVADLWVLERFVRWLRSAATARKTEKQRGGP
jgi:hypothetical protein